MDTLQLLSNKYKSRKLAENEIYDSAFITETVIIKHKLQEDVKNLINKGIVRKHVKKGYVTKYFLIKRKEGY